MKAQSRLLLVLIFLGAGALFFWAHQVTPQKTKIVFVLTQVEVPHESELLRYEHITRLTCRFLDGSGQSVASIVHNRPGAVTNPAQVQLPKATYHLDIALVFGLPRGGTKTMRYLKETLLDGGDVTISP